MPYVMQMVLGNCFACSEGQHLAQAQQSFCYPRLGSKQPVVSTWPNVPWSAGKLNLAIGVWLRRSSTWTHRIVMIRAASSGKEQIRKSPVGGGVYGCLPLPAVIPGGAIRVLHRWYPSLNTFREQYPGISFQTNRVVHS
jgi:hypothetical protein